MHEPLQVVIEMTESIGQRFWKDLEGVTAEEALWRPLPQANSITLIVRHLCIEAQWHRDSLERGEPMPTALNFCGTIRAVGRRGSRAGRWADRNRPRSSAGRA